MLMWYVAVTAGKYLELLKQLGVDQAITELEKEIGWSKRIGAKTTDWINVYPINLENKKPVGIDYDADNVVIGQLPI